MTYRQPFRGDFRISQRYGDYIEGVTVGTIHTGIDYACPLNTPILASAAGTVMACGWDATGYGNRVIIKHADGRATLYAHLNRVTVTLYELVGQGDQVGLSGSTGNSTGPHLHFEARTRWNDVKSHFDPFTLPLMSFADAALEQQKPAPSCLKAADTLGEAVQIVAPAGAWGWSADFSSRQTVYPCGTRLHFTGRTCERLGYTYCECYPEPAKYWVAVHDNDTQILDNTE